MSVALLSATAAQPSFTITATNVDHFSLSGATGTTSTNSAVTTSGGTSPFTYSCAYVGGATEITPTTPTSNTTTFGYALPFEGFYSSVFRWTVTDDNGLVATADVSVLVSYFT